MSRRHLCQPLGLVGSLLLLIGALTPLISFKPPIMGDIVIRVNYFQTGGNEGVLVWVIAGISLVLTLMKKYQGLIITGIGSLAVLAFTFLNFQTSLSSIRPFLKVYDSLGLAQATLDTVQLEWGWAVLIIGAGFLLAAAWYR